MGQEIVYCHKCQTRLLGSDFEKGKAFKVGGKNYCGACSKSLLDSMPEMQAEVDRFKKGHSTTRLTAQSPDSSSKFKATQGRPAPPPAPTGSKNPMIFGLILGIAALALLLAMAMSSSRSTPPPPPVDPPRSSGPIAPPTPPTPPPSNSLDAELRDVDGRMRDSFAKEEFRKLSEFLAALRKRRPEPQWLTAIEDRITQVEGRARLALAPVRDEAIEAQRRGNAAEVKKLRERIAGWGFPSLVEQFDKALAAPPPPPPPVPPTPPPPLPATTSSEPPFVIYGDAIAPGCRDHSWDATVDFKSTASVFEGTHAIAYTPTKKFAGLYLTADAKIDATVYPFVTFAICPLEDDLHVGAVVWASDKKTSTMIDLQKRGDLPKKGVWKRYTFPVSAFTPSDAKVLGLTLQTFKTSATPLFYADSVSFLKGAGSGVAPPNPEPSKEIEPYRARWLQAAAKAAAHDYAGAQKEIEDAASALKEASSKAEAAADVEAVKLASTVAAEAAAGLLKGPKYPRIRAEYLDENSARAAVEGPMMQVDALRVTILKDRDTIDLPLGEIAPATLADFFRARPDKKPESDARAAAAFCAFEGDADASRRHAAEGISEKYWSLPARAAEPDAEKTARRLFWTAEAEFKQIRSRGAALQKVATLLAEHERTAFVGRNKAFLAARLEAGRETFFFADDMVATGTMVAGESAKVETCWISGGDTQPARVKENTVDFEFYAQAGPAYKAWVYAGGCCVETFTFLIQGTELTAPNPKKIGEQISAEPGSDTWQTSKSPTLSLKRLHAAHGGPKEPAKWEWIPIALPKYATSGLKKIRLMTDQGGFAVAYAVVSVSRALPPREPELRELERSRVVSVSAPAPAGTILREWWLNIQGSQVEDLLKHPAFQGKPSGSDFRNIFEAPTNWADNYGQRMRGYVYPPVTGNYFFWLASDDGGEIYLSTDDTPAKKRSISACNMAGGVRDWTRTPMNKSNPMALVAGKRYYIEAYNKEGIGEDHLAVGWTLPDGSEERPIPGKRLAPYAPGAKLSGLTFYRALRLNGPSVTLDGLLFEGKGTPNWTTNGPGFENQAVELKPPTDPARASMIRSSVWTREGIRVSMSAVPPGSYAVFLYVWEDNASQTFDLFVNDRPVIGNYMSGEGGHWERLGPWITTPVEGKIEVRADRNDANFSGLEVWKLPNK